MTSTTPTRILILGGGFGGVYTALTLEKVLKRELRAPYWEGRERAVN